MGYLDDIRAQPQNLVHAHATFTQALHQVDLSPFRSGTLVLAGMGSSYFASIAGASTLRHAGRAAFALSSTDLLEPGADNLATAYIGISQSGKSTETVQAFSRLTKPRL